MIAVHDINHRSGISTKLRFSFRLRGADTSKPTFPRQSQRRIGAARRLVMPRGVALIILTVAGSSTTFSIRAGSETPTSRACEGDMTQPPYAPVGAAPAVRIWKGKTPSGSAAPPTCTGWQSAQSGTLLAVAGTFRTAEGSTGLISRFGNVSSLLSVRYWSTTDQAWRPLLLAANALTKSVGGQQRGDFTRAELESGQDLYFSQKDGRAATDVIYRMSLRKPGPDRFVVETENVTSVRWLALTLFKPGDLRSLYVLEQRSADTWSYYALTSIAGGSWLTAGHERSYINRAVALYRHFAGIPTDLEPPPAR
jgi:hypothetical protein